MTQTKRQSMSGQGKAARKSAENQEPEPDMQRTINLPASMWRKLDDAALRRKYQRAHENQKLPVNQRRNTRASVSEVIREILRRHEHEIDEFT